MHLVKKYLFVAIAFAFILSFACRQTKRFKNIEVQGRLVDYYTKQPIANSVVKLRADDVHSASNYSQASILLSTCITGPDGVFILKSKASKESGYYIETEAKNHIYYDKVDTFFSSEPNKIVNIGNINFGEHKFWFKIRLKSITSNCAWALSSFDSNYPTVKINSGVDTTILYNALFSYYKLHELDRNLNYYIKTGPCSNSTTAISSGTTFPISFQDTMGFQINF